MSVSTEIAHLGVCAMFQNYIGYENRQVGRFQRGLGHITAIV